jgi:hypothetical protein
MAWAKTLPGTNKSRENTEMKYLTKKLPSLSGQILLVSFVFALVLSVPEIVFGKGSDKTEKIIQGTKEQAKILRMLGIASQKVNLALGRLSNSQIRRLKYYQNAARALKLGDAIQTDIDAAKNNGFVVLKSQTLEQLRTVLIEMLPEVTAWLKDKNPILAKYSLPATFGAEDFTAATFQTMGDRGMDIDTWTHILDGAVKASWGYVGWNLSGGNPKAAQAAQAIGASLAVAFRTWTMPLFNSLWTRLSGQGIDLVKDWFILVDRALWDGRTVPRIDEIYRTDLLTRNGLTKKEIAQLNSYADKINGLHGMVIEDISEPKIQELVSTGQTNLAGLPIELRSLNVGKPPDLSPPRNKIRVYVPPRCSDGTHPPCDKPLKLWHSPCQDGSRPPCLGGIYVFLPVESSDEHDEPGPPKRRCPDGSLPPCEDRKPDRFGLDQQPKNAKGEDGRADNKNEEKASGKEDVHGVSIDPKPTSAGRIQGDVGKAVIDSRKSKNDLFFQAPVPQGIGR